MILGTWLILKLIQKNPYTVKAHCSITHIKQQLLVSSSPPLGRGCNRSQTTLIEELTELENTLEQVRKIPMYCVSLTHEID